MDSDGFIQVTRKKVHKPIKKKNLRSNKPIVKKSTTTKPIITTNYIDEVFNIYDLFNYIFSFTDLIDKLEFRSASKKCKGWTDHRLKNKSLCDDFDEFMFYDKNIKLKKFDHDIFKQYPLLFNKSNTVTNPFLFLNEIDKQTVIKFLLDNNSVFFLKDFNKSYANRCLNELICYFLTNTSKNISAEYKNIINKNVLNKTSCTLVYRIHCDHCSRLIYLCAETGWDPPYNLIEGLADDQIFHLMIVAGCHGSFNTFTFIYNYLKKNAVDFIKVQKMQSVSLLICYYRNYYLEYSRKNTIKLFLYMSECSFTDSNEIFKSKIDGYNQIIKMLSGYDNLNIDEHITKIFENSDQEYISDIFCFMMRNDDYVSATFFSKYMKKISTKILKSLMITIGTAKDENIKICSNLFQSLIMKKYGDVSTHTFLNMITTDVNSSDKNYSIDCIFEKYYLSLY